MEFIFIRVLYKYYILRNSIHFNQQKCDDVKKGKTYIKYINIYKYLVYI